jgi:hypothetical protein
MRTNNLVERVQSARASSRFGRSGGDGRDAAAKSAEVLLYDEYEEGKEDDNDRLKGVSSQRSTPGEDGDDQRVSDGFATGRQARIANWEDEDEDSCTGIPDLPLMMRVDIQGKFGREKSVLAFQTSFGSLPAMATLDITEMMYAPSQASHAVPKKLRPSRSSGRREDGGIEGRDDGMDDGASSSPRDAVCSRLPKEIFLSYPYIMQSYSRWKMYKSNEFSMDALKKSGCESHMLNRIMNVVRNTQGAYEKLDLFNDYLQRIIRQHMSSVMNNDLRSTHAMFTAKYIEQGRSTLCRDLRRLIDQIEPSFYTFMVKDKAASQVRDWAACMCFFP